MTENKTIHDFDFGLICEYFSGMERQGPGSAETTLKALSFVDGLGENSRIADIGCGTGAPTMVLAKNTKGKITGIDLFPELIFSMPTPKNRVLKKGSKEFLDQWTICLSKTKSLI